MNHLQNTAQELLEQMENEGITKWAYKESMQLHELPTGQESTPYPVGAIVFAVRLDMNACREELALFEFFSRLSHSHQETVDVIPVREVKVS